MTEKLAGSIDTDGTEHGLVFNQSDAGKTYRFIIREKPQHTINGVTNTTPDDVPGNPIASGDNAGDVRIDNVWFKQTQYMAEVTVHDNGNGTMYTVTKALKKDGNDEGFREYSDGNHTVTAGVLAVRASTPGYRTFDGAAFVNRVNAQELPFTGGTTMRSILLGGLALAAASLIAYGAYRRHAGAVRRRGIRI